MPAARSPARLASTLIGLLVRAEGGVDEVADEINRALPTFEAAGDDATVARLAHRGSRTGTGGDVRSVRWRQPSSARSSTLAAPRIPASSRTSRSGSASRRLFGPLAIDLARPRLDELIAGAAPESAVKGFLLVSSSLPGRNGRRVRRCALALSAKGRRSSMRSAAASALPRSRRGRARSSCLPAIPAQRNESSVPRSSSSRRSASARTLLRSPPSSRRRCTRRADPEEALAATVHERGGVLARRRPRADLVARRSREGTRPARPRPGGAGPRNRRRRARRHHRLSGVRGRGAARARGGARGRRRDGGGT